MIEILPESRWEELREVFDTEFEADLPNTGGANIIADVDEDGTIKGFIVAEHLLRIGQVYSFDKKARPRKLVKWLENNMGRDVSVIIIASDVRFESLCEKLKMRRVEGTVYRRDF